MSAVLQEHAPHSALAFVLMHTSDLDAVMAIEPTIFQYPWTRGNFSDALQSGYGCWQMLNGTQLIGYAVMMMVLDEAHILNISIAKPQQGRGLGRTLLQFLITEAQQKGALNMFLEVRISNAPALKLYERMGFNEMAIRRNYYPAAQGREDAVLMGLAL